VGNVPAGCELHFADYMTVTDALKSIAEVVPLSAAELAGPFSAKSHVRASDIRYWKPGNLGEGLFNWWD